MSDALLSQAEIDALLKEIPTADADPVPEIQRPKTQGSSGASRVTSGDITVTKDAGVSARKESRHPNLERILDIPLQVTVNLGEVVKQIEEVVSLAPGAIVEFEREVGDPVDIVLNGKLIARGEVVVIEENFGVRVTQIISPRDRIRKMG